MENSSAGLEAVLRVQVIVSLIEEHACIVGWLWHIAHTNSLESLQHDTYTISTTQCEHTGALTSRDRLATPSDQDTSHLLVHRCRLKGNSGHARTR